MHSKLRTFTGAVLGGALCVSSTMAAASTTPRVAVPSAPSGVTAACAATAAVAAGAATAAQAAAQPGCVLPVGGAVPVAAAPPPVFVDEPAPGLFGLGLPAILLGLAALAGAYFLLFRDKDDGDISITRA